MKVLILGGTGFVGRHLTAHLLNDGHEVAVFHRGKTHVNLPRGVRHIHGERARLSEYLRSFESFSPEVVVDLIAFSLADAQTTVKAFSGRTERLICASSMDVYQAYGSFCRLETGEVQVQALSEDAPLRRTRFPYRDSATSDADLLFSYEKIHVEETVLQNTSLPATVFRLPQVFGPHDRQRRLRDYLKHMTAGEEIVMPELKANWRWTRGYVEDIAAGLALGVINAKVAGRIYNIGEREAESESSWARRIAKAAGVPCLLKAVAVDRLPEGQIERYDWKYDLAGNTARIRRELGYTEKVAPEDAMVRSVRWEMAQWR